MLKPSSTYFRTPKEYEKLSNIMSTVVLFLAGVICFLSFVIAGRVLYGTIEPEYLARNVRGQLAPMLEIKPGPQQKMSKTFLIDAIQESFALTSDTYVNKMPSMKAYYSDKGYQNYIDIFRDLGVAKKIQEGPLFLSTSLTDTPILDEQESKVYDKSFVWVYYVNVIHTIRTTAGVTEIEKKYKVSMQQLPLTQRAFGLAIYSIRAV